MKTLRAVEKFKAKSVILGGGVSANVRLQHKLQEEIAKQFGQNVSYYCPAMKYTGDNAAMIAIAGYFHAKKKDFIKPQGLRVDCNWELV
jgi:N6-L-threonylcarbamoyladenine synthase